MIRMLKMIENILKTAIGKKERKHRKNEHSRRSIIEVTGLHF